MYFRILVVFLSSLIVGCSLNRAASLRMLDERAQYETGDGFNVAISSGNMNAPKSAPIPVRTRSKVAAIWIHRHETRNA